MASWTQEIQYYDWRFVTNEWNLVYQNIVNCVLCKPPYFNDSFRNLFAQSPWDKWDKSQFFVNKRPGFKKVWMYSEEDNTSDRDNPHVTDMKEVDGKRYFFVLNDVKTKMRVYKQVGVNDMSLCDNSCLNDITDWRIQNITSYKGKSYFPFKECLYDRFVTTTHVKWKKKDSWTKGIARVNRVWDTFFSSLVNEDGTDIDANAGDYVYITNGKWITWYVVNVWGKAANLPTWSMNIAPNAIMINGSWVPGIDMSASDGTILDDVTEDSIEYEVYSNYWLTLHWVTSDGIIHRVYDNDTAASSEYSYCWDTYFDTNFNTNNNPKQISCIISWWDSFSYIDNKTWILWCGGMWWTKFSFDPTLNIVTNWLYTRLIEYMGYLILIGPDNIWYFTREWTTWVTKMWTITDSNGYWSQWSINTADENFFIVRKSHDFYQMGIQSSYSNSIPVWFFTYMNNFLNTDLWMLVRWVDEINLDVADNKFWVFINNGSWNTKLLIFDRYYNLRHKRYIEWCDMERMCNGVFLWRGVFANVGTTDAGNDITQIITMTWWDMGHTANKRMEFVKLPIGYNSYIESGKTWFASIVTDWWRSYETIYWDLGRTDYVANLMRTKITPDLDNQALQVVNKYEVGIDVNNCLWSRAWIKLFNTYNEFNQYIATGGEESISSDGNDELDVCVAKMWVIKVPLWQWWEVFTFEIIARGDNKVEFGWFFLGYQYADMDITRLENVATLWDLTTDSWYTPEKNVNTPDELLWITV